MTVIDSMPPFQSRLSFVMRRAIAGILDLLTLRAKAGSGPSHILIAAPGGGNIGDAAMVESFIANTTGSVALVTSTRSDFDLESVVASRRVVIEALPGLLYGDLVRFTRDYWKLSQLMRGASSLSVIGADIMDGAYNERASVSRALVAERGARRGLDTRILGFSWNESPAPAASHAIHAAAKYGASMIVRDPQSASRLAPLVGDQLQQSADIVFLMKTESKPRLSFIDSVAEAEFVLVNISALVDTVAEQSDAYVNMINDIVSSGLQVVLVPHVLKKTPAGDDLAVCRSAYARTAESSRVHLVDRRLQPAEVRWLTKRASHVVTGRMHLAVMSLSHGTPVAVIGTQGKVEGLMELFAQKRYLISPDADLGVSLMKVERELRAARATESETIAAHLPEVTLAAARNVAGLR